MKWKQKIKTAIWVALGLGCVVLLFAATKKKDALVCQKISIDLKGEEGNLFINKTNILSALKEEGISEGVAINDMDIKDAEDALNKNPWIKNAELFINNKQQLTVSIEERQPVARIFTVDGASFYIDSSALRLPANGAVARVPVFTSFPSSKKKLSIPDSLVLNDVKHIATFIAADSFWNAQVSQINITSQGTYQMIPVIGNQLIILGNADSLQKKFDKLFIFYKNVWGKIGFEKYSSIDISFNNQIVAVRRGEKLPSMDTSGAISRMINTEKRLSSLMKDTNYSTPVKVVTASPIQKSTEKKSSKTVSSKQATTSTKKIVPSTKTKSVTLNKDKSSSTTIKSKSELSTKSKTVTPVKKIAKPPPKAVMKKPPK